jgi:alanyl-tRNA synthetase
VDEARLDITHFENLTPEQRSLLEREVNRIVLEGLKVNVKFMQRDEAEKLYGFRLYQGGAVPGGTIRVVVVSGLDAEACGGLHCKRTSQVGPVRIQRTKRIQDGIVRIEFSVGMPAIERMQKDKETVEKLSEILNTTQDQIVAVAEKYLGEWKEQKKDIERLTTNESISASENLLRDATPIGDTRLVTLTTKEGDDPAAISKTLTGNPKVVAIIGAVAGNNLKLFVSRSLDMDVDCRTLLKEITNITGGGGGGKKEFAQGGGGNPSRLSEALERAPDILRALLKGSG